MSKNLMIKPQENIYKSSFKIYRERLVDAFSTRLAVVKKTGRPISRVVGKKCIGNRWVIKEIMIINLL